MAITTVTNMEFNLHNNNIISIFEAVKKQC